MTKELSLTGALCFLALFARASETNTNAQPQPLPGARAELYKEVAGTKLFAYVFESESGPRTNRPAMVFFFGGGWRTGSPTQFEEQCRHFAARGMVAITADYRVESRQGVKPAGCVADAKSCIRWVRANAARLGIDPNRIAAGGGSAGGHLAAATATLPKFDEPDEDKSISSKPNALVLFNPALVLAPMDGLDLAAFTTRINKERFGTEPMDLSPAHHIKVGTPPTIIFHGKSDETVPYSTAEAFQKEMKKAGNRCELVGYAEQGHGFFNARNANGQYLRDTLGAADTFLVSLGYLESVTATK